MMRFRQASVIVSLLLVFTSVLSVYPAPIIGIPSVDAASHNIALEGVFQGWNTTNPSIIVAQGDTVSLSLKSLDTFHLFYIDINKDGSDQCPEEKCSDVFPPDTSLSFSVDFPAGTYEYVCPFHPGQMRGNFAVKGFTIAFNPSSLRVFQGSSNTSVISVTSVNGFAGVVDLSTTVSPSGPTVVLNPASVAIPSGGTETSTLTVSATGNTPLGSYNVNVAGTSGSSFNTRSVATSVVPPDFGISADPTSLVIQLGSAGSSTITLSSLGSFLGDIDLSASSLPLGITATFSPNPVLLPSGGMVTSMLDLNVSSATSPGTYVVDVIGSNGSLTRSTTLTVVAGPDFDISPNPTTMTLTPGSSDTSTIRLTSFNNFTGTVNLSSTATPGGTTFSFNPSSVSLSEGGSATVVLTVNAPATAVAANYTVTVNATSVPLTHSSTIIVSVRDFSVTVSSSSLTVHQGTSVTLTVSVTSLNGFVGFVSLATTASSSTLFRLLNVTTLSLNPSGTGFAALTINASSVQPGTYTVSITGTSGSLSRAASLSITVQPSTGEASILPLIGGAAVAVIAVATAVLYYTRRRRFGGKTSDSQVPT